MDTSNLYIHCLWIGDELSPMERLSLASFVAHGHKVLLWRYAPLEEILPDQITIKDANEILPSSAIFFYNNSSDLNIGKGSVAGFSDLFRYKVLYEKGGWWTDLDITLLKPLDFKEDYFFRSHTTLPVVGNLMKCPKHSPLMAACFESTQKEVNAHNRDWLKPIRILNEHIQKNDLSDAIKRGVVNPDYWPFVQRYVLGKPSIPSSFYAIHWMNEEWRHRGLNKSEAFEYSVYHSFLEKYKIPHDPKKLDWKTKWKLNQQTIYQNGKNWIKRPGFPVFLKRWYLEKIQRKDPFKDQY